MATNITAYAATQIPEPVEIHHDLPLLFYRKLIVFRGALMNPPCFGHISLLKLTSDLVVSFQ